MSGHWVSANEARSTILQGPGDFELATQAILKSASVGLIATRAEIFIYENDVESRERLNCKLPTFFWPRENFDAFQQDWTRSIFSKLGGKIRCHAFGVIFSQAHLEQMMRSDEMKPKPKKLPPLENPARDTVSGKLDESVLISQEEARQRLGIGRTKLSEMLADCQLESVKIGRRRLVKVSSVRRLAGIDPEQNRES